MKESELRKYAGLMKELELTALEVRENDRVVRLERSVPAGTAVYAAPAASVAPFAPQSAQGQAQAEASSGSDASLVEVKSQMVGVFYASPAEDAEPYVSIGGAVKGGDTLCIIEAMKLMNEITAECDGTVEEILAANGQTVEYGTSLFRIRRRA